jgi:hypothetical protein
MTDQYALTAPPPLAPIKHVVISERNIELERRTKRARRLKRNQVAELKNKLATLQKETVNKDREQLEQLYAQAQQLDQELLPDMVEALAFERSVLLEAGGDHSEAVAMLDTQLDDLRQQLALVENLPSIEAGLEQFQHINTIKQQLHDHQLAVRRDQAERKLRLEMSQEMDIYRQIIIDRWTALGYCHRYQKGKTTRVDKVKISEAFIMPDSIYFKIDVSRKTFFGGFKTMLPLSVRVADHLLSESTLRELTIACQRQVTGIITQHNGSWAVVHRLETIDGLMNYLAYKSIMDYYPAGDQTLVPIPIGVGTSRNMQWITLAEFPHGLIAGYTNSGKSNIANVIICTIIEKQSPRDVRLMLIDLKGGLEFNFYDGLPHLHGGIVDNIEAVREGLADVEALMHQRFEQFKGVSKNYVGYRLKRPNDYMPRLIIFFDEVASIMDHGETTKAILASMREISRLGRAVGIHLWLATQRPDSKAVEGAIKVNLAVRVSGRMPTTADSLTILGTSEAAKLAAVPGRMVLQLGPDPIPVQTPHIDEADIVRAIETAMSYPIPPALEIPEQERVIHQQWTPERVIELSLTHLGGNISSDAVWKAAKEDISQRQARELVEKVWALAAADDGVEFNGIRYELKRLRGQQKRLVPVTS